MHKLQKNNAYIDGANLHKGITSQKWRLDYKRFRVWLTEKYAVKHAYLFIGYIQKYKDLYNEIRKNGFILIFKEVVYDENGKPKGNCDADLVLNVIVDFFEKKYENAVIVSSDGDYASLIKALLSRHALRAILSPANEQKCSILLKKTDAPITYLGQERTRNLIEASK